MRRRYRTTPGALAMGKVAADAVDGDVGVTGTALDAADAGGDVGAVPFGSSDSVGSPSVGSCGSDSVIPSPVGPDSESSFMSDSDSSLVGSDSELGSGSSDSE